MPYGPVRIGTRGSPLALAQANEVKMRLAQAHGIPADRIEIVVIRTTGDREQQGPLAAIGGKGLFTKEIEEALLSGAADLAVHSAKDMTAVLPAGLAIGAVLPREDPRDAFLSITCPTFADLPPGAAVGTSSPRRAAQVRRLRPDVAAVDLRGNVGTRLAKLEAGMVSATFLAVAGLKRLGLARRITAVMDPAHMLPAVAQGAIAIEIRADSARAAELAAPLNDPVTAACVAAERAFLAALEGSCRTPIAALAEPADGGRIRFRGRILMPGGGEAWETQRIFEAAAAGETVQAARSLLEEAGPRFAQAIS